LAKSKKHAIKKVVRIGWEENYLARKILIILKVIAKDRPEGLDMVVQYFPTMEDYLRWKLNHSKFSG